MPITVLGQTFDTQNQRREYFRNELRKHLPELKKMEGFPIGEDEVGRWYVPDPEKEVDLEKLRTKRLLKLFADYREQASKPKGKIKEARVEALRAGF